jgi:tartrate-resistant acid phosphatase type 5
MHWEQFVFVADLTSTSVTIAWGHFPIELGTQSARIVDQSELDCEFIGFNASSSYRFRVALYENGVLFREQTVDGRLFAQFNNLQPSTTYTYQVFLLNDQGSTHIWGSAPRRLSVDNQDILLTTAEAPLIQRFQTFPDNHSPTPAFRFFVIGDPGVGIDIPPSENSVQKRVADKMVQAMDNGPEPRFVLVLGDLIYGRGSNNRIKQRKKKVLLGLVIALSWLTGGHPPDLLHDSGDEDDEWYPCFFEPYRDLLARMPFYPAVGNHDTSETEIGDDRFQLFDNLFLVHRFGDSVLKNGASYSFSFGRSIKFACLDTTAKRAGGDRHFLTHDNAKTRVKEVLSSNGIQSVIPFGHHPPHCAGPSHNQNDGDIKAVRNALWNQTLLLSNAIRVSFWGHEHNFQHLKPDQRDVIITGAAGKAGKIAATGHNSDLKDAMGGAHFLDCRYSPPDGRLHVKVVVCTPDSFEYRGDLEFSVPLFLGN